MNAAVFLDRDNTIIRNDGDLGDPAKVELIQGAAAAVASLCGLGFRVFVVTNQGGVARGKYTEDDVNAVHQRIAELMREKANGAEIDAFYYCPYHPDGTVQAYRQEHPDRKPQPGMLLKAAEKYELDLAQCWMIGDQMRDVEAGLAAGCRTILLKADATRLTPLHADAQSRQHHLSRDQEGAPPTPEFYSPNLIEAVRVIAQQRRPDFTGEGGSFSGKERRWDAAAVARLQQRKPHDPPETKTFPANDTPESTRDGQGNIYRPRATTRPFRPVGAMGPEPTPPPPGAKPPVQKSPPPPKETAAKQSARSGAPSLADASPPEVMPKPAQSEHEASASVPAAPASAAQPTRTEMSKPIPVERPGVPVELPGAETQRLLQQILSELRQQRGVGGEFSWLTILALVLQGVAVLCLIGAFWMGSGDNGTLFLKWILVALMLQVGTVAMLLFQRHVS